jgi:hypothetical protein
LGQVLRRPGRILTISASSSSSIGNMSASSARPRNGSQEKLAPVRARVAHLSDLQRQCAWWAAARDITLPGAAAQHYVLTTAPDHSGAPTFGDVPVPNAPNTLAAAWPGAAPSANGGLSGLADTFNGIRGRV